MIDIAEMVTDIHRRLEQYADFERLDLAQRSYPTAMQVIGVKVPDLRPLSKEISRKVKKAPPEEVIALAKALVATDIFECRQIAYEVLEKHKAALATLQLSDLEDLSPGLDNWVSVDEFGGRVAGPIWREGGIPDDVVRGWAHSEDRWWRRVAVVCTVALNQKARGGTGDAPRTLDICRLVAADQDDMVAKALSWALRELAKREVDPVVAFLEEYESVLPARVKREVRRKIETGRKYDRPSKEEPA
jgi:3-methyladenine DNA glycosylase AlkD